MFIISCTSNLYRVPNFDRPTLHPTTLDDASYYSVYLLWSPMLCPPALQLPPTPCQLTACLCCSEPL